MPGETNHYIAKKTGYYTVIFKKRKLNIYIQKWVYIPDKYCF